MNMAPVGFGAGKPLAIKQHGPHLSGTPLEDAESWLVLHLAYPRLSSDRTQGTGDSELQGLTADRALEI